MNFRLILATAAFLAALPATTANAAPQLLGLLADGALPLNCENGTCSVEVSAICLQEARDMPAWQTAYTPVQPDRIVLSGEAGDGELLSRPVGHLVSIEATRGSWAVTISLPESAIRDAGMVKAALSIEGRAVLQPAPEPGDLLPQTAADIAIATAAFGRPHETVIGDASPGMAAAHVMNDMINALPHIALDPDKPGGDLWRKTFGNDARDKPGMRRAAKFYDACADPVIYVESMILRRCLELGHDDIVTHVNKDYWDANKPGM